MTPIELHPEGLLDRALHGGLGAEEREVLGAHVNACPACAVHLRARELFQYELAERDEDSASDLLAVNRAMSAVRADGETPLSRRGRMRWPIRVMMAALVLGGFVAGAYYARGHRSSSAPTGKPAGIATAGGLGPRTSPATVATAAQPAEVERASSGPVTNAPGLSSSAAQPHLRTKPGAAMPVASDSADALFARANQLRRNGRDSEAMTVYRELQRAFPDSREAKLSQATLARLQLEHGQAAEALSGFDSYLKSGASGSMTEDALVGRAMALMKLSQRDEERATWQELLVRFPNSIHASRARARLGELR
jgi:TolA-binding protein